MKCTSAILAEYCMEQKPNSNWDVEQCDVLDAGQMRKNEKRRTKNYITPSHHNLSMPFSLSLQQLPPSWHPRDVLDHNLHHPQPGRNDLLFGDDQGNSPTQVESACSRNPAF